MSTRNTVGGNNVNKMSLTKGDVLFSYTDRDPDSDAFVGVSEEPTTQKVLVEPLDMVSDGIILKFDCILPNNLLARDYAANASGQAWQDFGPQGYEFLLYNGITTDGSDGRGSLIFDGIDDYCRLAVSGQPQPDGGFPVLNNSGTISHWLKSSRPNINTLALYMASGSVGALNGYGAGSVVTEVHTGLGAYKARLDYAKASPENPSPTFSSIATYPKILINEWYEITTTWDELGETRVYVNGQLENTSDMTTQTYGSGITPMNVLLGAPATILTSNGWNREWTGKIANVMLYDRPLSSAEIKQNYDASKYRFQPNVRF